METFPSILIFVALDATWSSHHIDQKTGSKLVLLPLLISFCLNFLPFLVDGAMGYQAFGTTAIEISFAVAGIFPGAFFQWLIFMYAWGPAYFQYLSTKREEYLYAMIGGENLDGRASAKVAPPRLDLTDPSNIIAFSAIYRVLHGNNFARSMQKRFSMYLVVTFSIIVFGATKSVFSEQYGITVEGRIGDKISSIVILCIFVSFVSLQVVAAWTVNEFTKDLALEKELVIFGEQFWRPYCHVKDFSNAFITVLKSPNEKVAYNVFNVGDTKENYTKQMLVNEIKKVLPKSKIKYVAKNEDARDYRVNCDKIQKELGFKISMTVPDGIKEIKRVIQENLIQDPEDQKYYNIPHERK